MMEPFDLLARAAFCRRAARATEDAGLAQALNELADDFEAAAFDSVSRMEAPVRRPRRRKPKRLS
jgi:hypothetical protein